MSEPFIGQIMMGAFAFAPRGFAQCNGQLLPVAQNSTLFALLGTFYGGDGKTTFALPDLRSRSPGGGGFASTDPTWTASYGIGEAAGVENVTLTPGEMPMHNHIVTVTSAPGVAPIARGGATLGSVGSGTSLYGSVADTTLAPQSLSTVGGGTAHTNIQPYSTINFSIALTGIFPSRN